MRLMNLFLEPAQAGFVALARVFTRRALSRLLT